MPHIYCLKDPDTKFIRYIGKTNSLENRYKNHLNSKELSNLGLWIRSLLELNKEPMIESMEMCDEDVACEREAFYISKYKPTNILLNKYGNVIVHQLDKEVKKRQELEEFIMKDIVIDKGLQIPFYRKFGYSKYPFEIMEIGDSFIAGEYYRGFDISVLSCAKRWAIKNGKGKWCFVTRKVADNKLRIWRVDDKQ